jgi:hypothetical protein
MLYNAGALCYVFRTSEIPAMPKKKASNKASREPSPERMPRKEPYTSERLRAIVERLRKQSMRLAGLARGMDDAEVEEVVVDGHAMLMRGLNQTDNFADNCARAVREAKGQRTSV